MIKFLMKVVVSIFNSGSTKSKTVDFDGGSLVIKAEPVNDGGEWDSRWYIESFTGTLPKVGTAFQTKFNGGKDKVTIHFKVTGTAPTVTAHQDLLLKNYPILGLLVVQL